MWGRQISPGEGLWDLPGWNEGRVSPVLPALAHPAAGTHTQHPLACPAPHAPTWALGTEPASRVSLQHRARPGVPRRLHCPASHKGPHAPLLPIPKMLQHSCAGSLLTRRKGKDGSTKRGKAERESRQIARCRETAQPLSNLYFLFAASVASHLLFPSHLSSE